MTKESSTYYLIKNESGSETFPSSITNALF